VSRFKKRVKQIFYNMIYLKKLLLGSCCCLALSVAAQQKDAESRKKTSNDTPKHEIGIDANAFLGQIYQIFGGRSNELNPYMLIYKRRLKSNTAIRAGLNANFRSLTESSGTFADTRTNREMNYGLRVGYEWQRGLDERWYYTYGGDVGGGYRRRDFIVNSGFDVATSIESGWNFKFGAIGGIWYRFSKSISVGTEVTWYYKSENLAEEKVFTSNPQFNKKGKITTEDKLELKNFGNIFFTIRF
jgi:opacity protein-like surface antigen